MKRPVLICQSSDLPDTLYRFAPALMIAVREHRYHGKIIIPDKSKPECALWYSGLLVHTRGLYIWITASHVIRELNIILSDRSVFAQIKAPSKHVAVEPVPIDLTACHRFSFQKSQEDDLGVDVGAVILPVHVARLLIASGYGFMSPVDFARRGEQFDAYSLLGYPRDACDARTRRRGADRIAHFRLRAPMLALFPTPPPDNSWRKPLYRRFFGIYPNHSNTPEGEFSIDDVRGMSGGPVFGINRESEGPPSIRLIGIQSVQGTNTGVLAVCPVRTFVSVLRKRLLRAMESAA